MQPQQKMLLDFVMCNDGDCPRCGSDCGYEGGRQGSIKKTTSGDEVVFTCEDCGFSLGISRQIHDQMVEVIKKSNS
jgi:hypothetical protein